MYTKILVFISLAITALMTGEIKAQCFASPGNPVGGAENMGVMNKNHLRLMTSYRYHNAKDYFSGDKLYTGNKRTLEGARYNYGGMLLAYGITDRLSFETESGYFFNKTQSYLHSGSELTGFGASNLASSMKYAIYQNHDKRIEFTLAAGGKIPLSRTFQRVDGVELPIDLQPSTASYGYLLQSYFIKENSFNAWRFFLINRFEKNFESPNGYIFGSSFSTAAFFSKHYIWGKGPFKDWTFIIQGRHQYQEKNIRKGNPVDASGGHLLLLSPQINSSINEKWNISLMYERIVYRYYNEVQLGGNYTISLHLSRDINFNRKEEL